MLGLGSLEAALAFWLCLAATLLCVVYGAANWNKEGKPDRVKTERTVIPGKKTEKTDSRDESMGANEQKSETRQES